MSYAKIDNNGGGGGDRFTVAEHVGHLLEIEVLSVRDMETSMGPARAANVNIRDVTQGESYQDVLVFQKVVVGALATVIGQTVLVYLRQGVASPGKSAPYLLIDASDDPEAVALAQAGAKAAPAAKGDDEMSAAVEALGGLLS